MRTAAEWIESGDLNEVAASLGLPPSPEKRAPASAPAPLFTAAHEYFSAEARTVTSEHSSSPQESTGAVHSDLT